MQIEQNHNANIFSNVYIFLVRKLSNLKNKLQFCEMPINPWEHTQTHKHINFECVHWIYNQFQFLVYNIFQYIPPTLSYIHQPQINKKQCYLEGIRSQHGNI